jgi:hypothetical protein
MNLTILSLRSGMATSWQEVYDESNGFALDRGSDSGVLEALGWLLIIKLREARG